MKLKIESTKESTRQIEENTDKMVFAYQQGDKEEVRRCQQKALEITNVVAQMQTAVCQIMEVQRPPSFASKVKEQLEVKQFNGD